MDFAKVEGSCCTFNLLLNQIQAKQKCVCGFVLPLQKMAKAQQTPKNNLEVKQLHPTDQIKVRCGLINSSMAKHKYEVADIISLYELDGLFLTETWADAASDPDFVGAAPYGFYNLG